MRPPVIALSCAILLICCNGGYGEGDQQSRVEIKKDGGRKYRQEMVNVDRPSPNVDFSNYVLITDNVEADRRDADAIMKLRANLPIAVQTKNAALFDRILARGFIFRAEDEFWNREQYIRTRIGEPETVGSARYENVVLQLFGEVAVSTYRNVVQLRNATGGSETLYMTWASAYMKENGEWKIGSVQLIDKKTAR